MTERERKTAWARTSYRTNPARRAANKAASRRWYAKHREEAREKQRKYKATERGGAKIRAANIEAARRQAEAMRRDGIVKVYTSVSLDVRARLHDVASALELGVQEVYRAAIIQGLNELERKHRSKTK